MNYRIKEICDEKGIKVNSIAEKVGITLPALYNIVNGKMSPKVETLEKIATALNVPMWQLFVSPEEVKESRQDIIGLIRAKGENFIVDSTIDLTHVLFKLLSSNQTKTNNQPLININDLRLGNLVLHNNIIKRIAGITLAPKGTFGDYAVLDGSEVISIYDITPINFLDSNYLTELGFKFGKDTEGSESWVNGKLVYVKIVNDKFCLWDYDAEREYYRNIFKTEFHLLQNQYYFLTGSELDVSKIK